MRKTLIILCLAIFIVVLAIVPQETAECNTVEFPITSEVILDTVPEFYYKTPKEGLKEALDYYEIKHPEVVHAQAVLETGHFRSKVCLEKNNLFGLYDSKHKTYFRFNHWTESVEAYRDMIQSRYKPEKETNNAYLIFLSKSGYAKNGKHYIKAIKRVMEN